MIIQHRIYLYILLILTAIVTACGSRPGNVLSEEEMIDVLSDVKIAEAIYRNSYQEYDTNEKKDALIESVFAKYKIKRADFDSSLVWYSDHIEDYRKVNDSVSERLRRRSEKMFELKMAMTSKTENRLSALVPPMFYLNELQPTMYFNIDSTKIGTVDLSSFHLAFNVAGLADQKVDSHVFFNYKDTVINISQTLDSNRAYEFIKPQMPDSLLKSISGYIHLGFNSKLTKKSNVIIYNVKYQKTNQDETSNPDLDSSEVDMVKSEIQKVDK